VLATPRGVVEDIHCLEARARRASYRALRRAPSSLACLHRQHL